MHTSHVKKGKGAEEWIRRMPDPVSPPYALCLLLLLLLHYVPRIKGRGKRRARDHRKKERKKGAGGPKGSMHFSGSVFLQKQVQLAQLQTLAFFGDTDTGFSFHFA